jgi:hypothetical protein
MLATDDWEVAVRERAEVLRRNHELLSNEPTALILFTVRNLEFVQVLSFIRRVTNQMLSAAGGAPAKRLVYHCDLFLSLVGDPLAYLNELGNRIGGQSPLPSEIGALLSEQIRLALIELNSFSSELLKIRNWAATPTRISASLAEVNQRVEQANQAQSWIKLRDIAPTSH